MAAQGRVGLAVLLGFLSVGALTAEIPQSEWEALKQQVSDLKRENEEIKKGNLELAKKLTGTSSSAAVKVLDTKYGPNAPVSTKTGKLTLGTILQIWYTVPQKDNKGLFQDSVVNGIDDTNTASDNSGFRIRRTKLRFVYDMNDSITSVIMIDPAREAQSFAGSPDNQATQVIFKRGLNANLANVQGGIGSAPRMLQDAYILYHGVVPHHEFQVGQFKPKLGDEALRADEQLDFIERSMATQLADFRDMGIVTHGSWWNDDGKGGARFQYWAGMFDSAGNYYQSAGQYSNRADDNNQKDFNYRVLVRPLWKQKTWGSLELGMSSEFGVHGQPASSDPIDAPLNGLNRRQTWAIRHYPWLYYAPGSIAKGIWLRSEYNWQKDRNAPQSVIDLLGQGNSGDGTTQTNGKPFVSQGGYVALGYRLWEAPIWRNDCPAWYKNFEFDVRFDQYQNVEVANSVRPDHTDAYRTNVFTGGINYYIQGDTKIQLNYNSVVNPHAAETAGYVFHNTRNNQLILYFQVAF